MTAVYDALKQAILSGMQGVELISTFGATDDNQRQIEQRLVLGAEINEKVTKQFAWLADYERQKASLDETLRLLKSKRRWLRPKVLHDYANQYERLKKDIPKITVDPNQIKNLLHELTLDGQRVSTKNQHFMAAIDQAQAVLKEIQDGEPLQTPLAQQNLGLVERRINVLMVKAQMGEMLNVEIMQTQSQLVDTLGQYQLLEVLQLQANKEQTEWEVNRVKSVLSNALHMEKFLDYVQSALLFALVLSLFCTFNGVFQLFSIGDLRLLKTPAIDFELEFSMSRTGILLLLSVGVWAILNGIRSFSDSDSDTAPASGLGEVRQTIKDGVIVFSLTFFLYLGGGGLSRLDVEYEDLDAGLQSAKPDLVVDYAQKNKLSEETTKFLLAQWQILNLEKQGFTVYQSGEASRERLNAQILPFGESDRTSTFPAYQAMYDRVKQVVDWNPADYDRLVWMHWIYLCLSVSGLAVVLGLLHWLSYDPRLDRLITQENLEERYQSERSSRDRYNH